MDLSTSPRADGLNEWTAPRARLDGKSALQHLFNRLDGMYPGQWMKNFPSPQSIQNWKDECERVFEEEGITLIQVAAGLRACRRKHPDWPPSVPQLADACNPAVDPVAAYHEAVARLEARNKGQVGAWSHPAVYWAASKLGRDLMSQPGAAMKDRWAAALKAQLECGQWAPIPAARVLLDPPGPSKLTKDQAAALLAKLGAANVTKKTGGKFDHLRWARRLLEREAAGDALTLDQLKAARYALGIVIQQFEEEIKTEHECSN